MRRRRTRRRRVRPAAGAGGPSRPPSRAWPSLRVQRTAAEVSGERRRRDTLNHCSTAAQWSITGRDPLQTRAGQGTLRAQLLGVFSKDPALRARRCIKPFGAWRDGRRASTAAPPSALAVCSCLRSRRWVTTTRPARVLRMLLHERMSNERGTQLPALPAFVNFLCQRHHAYTLAN